MDYTHLLRRWLLLLVGALGLTVVAPTSAWAQPTPLPGGFEDCHVFSRGGVIDIPLDIIIPEADLPIHLAHGDAYPVPPGGCRPRSTTTTSTTTLPTTTVPSTSSTVTTTTTTTLPTQTCPTGPTTTSGSTTTLVAVGGELPVTGAGPRAVGAVGIVLLVAGVAIAVRARDQS